MEYKIIFLISKHKYFYISFVDSVKLENHLLKIEPLLKVQLKTIKNCDKDENYSGFC